MPQSLTRPQRLCLVFLAISLWTALCYVPTLQGPFFFDDEHFIQRNELVHDWKRIPELYTSTVTQGAAIKGNFYRPNQQLVYTLLYQWVGQSTAVPYHMVQIGLHITVGCLTAYLFLTLGLSLAAAAVGALFFLLHPVQTEAVSYISGLADPLAAVFMLGGLVVVARHSWCQRATLNAWHIAAFTTLMVAALFTKENAVVLGPLVVLLTIASAVVWQRRPIATQWYVCGIAVGLSGLWSVLKLTVFNFGTSLGLSDASNAYTQSLAMRLSTFVSVLWDYAVMIVWPAELFYEKPYRAYDSVWTARGAFGLALMGTAAVIFACGRRWPRAALAFGIVFAALLPFVGIVPLNAIFLEHWLYMPMLGLSLFAALAMESARNKGNAIRYGALAITACLLLSASVRTYARNAQWADVEAFYLNELTHSSDAGRIYNNLGMYYGANHDEAKALKYYELAANSPAGALFAQPHHNLALSYLRLGRNQEALAQLRAALRVDPQFVYSLNVLEQVFAHLRDQTRRDAVSQALAAVRRGEGYDYRRFDAEVFGEPTADSLVKP